MGHPKLKHSGEQFPVEEERRSWRDRSNDVQSWSMVLPMRGSSIARLEPVWWSISANFGRNAALRKKTKRRYQHLWWAHLKKKCRVVKNQKDHTFTKASRVTDRKQVETRADCPASARIYPLSSRLLNDAVGEGANENQDIMHCFLNTEGVVLNLTSETEVQ